MSARIAVVVFPAPGHFQSIVYLGRELSSRGHEVTYFCVPDGEEGLRSKGVEPEIYGSSQLPRGALSAMASGTLRTSSYRAILGGLRFQRTLIETTLGDLSL